jgi:hypothetical protein
MENVWIWNIDGSQQQFFADELKAGRLRQGWGYDDRLDLRLISKKVEQKQVLDEKESETWTRLNVMIADWGIKLGDIILVKNNPTWGKYTLAKVTGGYQFDRKTPSDDHGHFIEANPLKVVEKHCIHVAGDLRASIDSQRRPITSAVKRASEILSLLRWPETELLKPVGWKERVASQSASVTDLIKKQIVDKLGPSEFEALVKEMLNAENFSNTTLKVTAGSGENGADIVMTVSAPFFDELNIVVQIKHHPGEDNDTTSIDQLRRAFDYYKAVAGLLVTSGSTIGPQLKEAAEKLKTEGKTVEILYGEELYRRVLHVIASETDDGA